jgi:hypothetical protein
MRTPEQHVFFDRPRPGPIQDVRFRPVESLVDDSRRHVRTAAIAGASPPELVGATGDIGHAEISQHVIRFGADPVVLRLPV